MSSLVQSSLPLQRYRVVLGLFILGLILSGITAFPLLHELDLLVAMRGLGETNPSAAATGFDHWLLIVRDGLRDSYARNPWIAYGTDWLAFAHLIIAVFFIGPLIDPCRNVWVIQAGIAACALVIPLAVLCGEIRGIPWGWRLIDCSFGVLGVVPLLYCLRLTRQMADDASVSR